MNPTNDFPPSRDGLQPGLPPFLLPHLLDSLLELGRGNGRGLRPTPHSLWRERSDRFSLGAIREMAFAFWPQDGAGRRTTERPGGRV